MVTCPRCDRTLTAEELVRHQSADLTLVHCPACHGLLGTYLEPGVGR